MTLPFYRIDLNEVPYPVAEHITEQLLVTPASAIKMRREVERFAIYFRREFSYDFQQFEATEKIREGDKAYAAYLFINEPNHYPRVWTGACCFRWRNLKDAEPRWGMQWMWLHPYYRGQGILTRAWDKFHEAYGNFLCEPPFSAAMQAFLLKRAKCICCWNPLDVPGEVVCSTCRNRKPKERTPK